MRIAALVLALSVAARAQTKADPKATEQLPADAQPSASGAGSTGLIIGGTVVLGSTYGFSLGTAALYGLIVVPIIAATHSRIPTGPFYLFIPVAGPLLINHYDNPDPSLRTLLYIDAAGQALGLALLRGRHRLAAGRPPLAGAGLLAGGAGVGGHF
jgi:hypothetical protein